MAQSLKAPIPNSALILLGKLSPIYTETELACSMEVGSMRETTFGRKC